jgi:hypothetical protein
MIEIIFTVVQVKRYSNSSMIWVKTSAPQDTTNGRFFVKDSNIWQVGNKIRRTVQKVTERIEMPNTIYVESMGLYRIQDELI